MDADAKTEMDDQYIVVIDPSDKDVIVKTSNDIETSSEKEIEIPMAKDGTIEEHRLRNPWTLWYLSNEKEKDWLERLHEVCTVESVEQFWALYDNIRPPSGLNMNCDYNFFKINIQPVWEVPENKPGGRLVVQIDKGRTDLLDSLWLELLLTLVGEQFGGDSDQICGAVCNIRSKGHKICLWTKNAESEEINRRIGGILKERFQMIAQCSIRVTYEEHNAAASKSSSHCSSRFILN